MVLAATKQIHQWRMRTRFDHHEDIGADRVKIKMECNNYRFKKTFASEKFVFFDSWYSTK